MSGSLAARWATAELAALEGRGLRRRLEMLSSPQGPEVVVGGERLVNFSSNDYLGLCAEPRLAEAAAEAARLYGTGSGASRLVVGDLSLHHSLEARLAAFERTEAALLFNSGYAANVGALSALCGEGDVLFSDALNHASLVDGCRLSRARTVVYPHGDVAALATLMRQHPGRRRMVCTDAVFSMDGDLAPLAELSALCQRESVALYVDEAHATGVFGARGAGLCEALGVEAQVDVRMGTLSKALGGFGAYVASSREVVELLVNRARSLVFSTSLPPAVCAAAHTALDLCEEAGDRRAQLWRNIRRFADGLSKLGFPAQPRSAVFPLMLGAPEAAVAAAAQLRAHGVLAKPIRPPTVPPGTSRVRFALSALHTEAHLNEALRALCKLEVSHAAA